MTALTPLQIASVSFKHRGMLRMPPDTDHVGTWHVIIQGGTEESHNARDTQGKPITIWEYNGQTPSRTPAQAARRILLQQAVAFYRTLTTDEKKAYKAKADQRKITIWNEVMSEYMTNPPPITTAQWDAGASIWDLGSSVWDSTESIPWDLGLTIWDSGISHWPE